MAFAGNKNSAPSLRGGRMGMCPHKTRCSNLENNKSKSKKLGEDKIVWTELCYTISSEIKFHDFLSDLVSETDPEPQLNFDSML